MKKDVKEEQIQTLLSEFEEKVRRYVDAIKNGPQTFDHVERTYEAIFNGGAADIVKIGLAMLEGDKKKVVPLAQRDSNFARIVKELSPGFTDNMS